MMCAHLCACESSGGTRASQTFPVSRKHVNAVAMCDVTASRLLFILRRVLLCIPTYLTDGSFSVSPDVLKWGPVGTLSLSQASCSSIFLGGPIQSHSCLTKAYLGPSRSELSPRHSQAP